MSKNKILFVLPSRAIKEKYMEDKRIIFFDYNFWSLKNEHKRKEYEYEYFYNKSSYYKNFRALEVIKLLRFHAPTFSRWFDQGSQYELYYRSVLIDIFKIFSSLKKLNIKYVIFQTSVSHHVDTLVIELACRLAKVNQIFLYNVFSKELNAQYGRLLPLFQNDAINDRIPIKKNISDYNYEEDLKELIDFARSRISSPAIFNFKTKSYYFCKMLVIRNQIKFKIQSIFKKIKIINNPNMHNIGIFSNYTIQSHFKQMKNQKDSIKYYQNNILSNKEIDTFKNEKNIIIAAHYQPEATSFPEGGKYGNHIDIIFDLRRKGFDGNILYKEHPGSFLYYDDYVGPSRVGMFRSVDYYKQLEDLGCKFLDTSFQLSLNSNDNWYIPLTITGSIALERSLSGLNTIVAGNPWYGNIPGSINLSDINNLEIPKILNNTHNIKIEIEAFRYMKDLLSYKTIFNGWGVGTGKKPDQEFQNIFLNELNNLLRILK